MGSAVFPKILGKGSPLCASADLLEGLPSEWEWEQTAGPHVGPFQVDVPLLGTCVTLWLLAQHLCVSEASYTHWHEPQPLSCRWGALVRGCLLSQQSLEGPGLGLGSSQRPPEGLKSSRDFLGPWTLVFVMDLCAATGKDKGRSRQNAAAVKLKRSPERQPVPPCLSRFQN